MCWRCATSSRAGEREGGVEAEPAPERTVALRRVRASRKLNTVRREGKTIPKDSKSCQSIFNRLGTVGFELVNRRNRSKFMARKKSPYEEVLASFQSRKGWFESTPYGWKQVDPRSNGGAKDHLRVVPRLHAGGLCNPGAPGGRGGRAGGGEARHPPELGYPVPQRECGDPGSVQPVPGEGAR